MIMVGESVAISGVAKSKDTSFTGEDEIETGFFNMIDATEERLGEDKKTTSLSSQQTRSMS